MEAVAVGQPVHRDDRLNGVRPSGQVERRAQRGGAGDVAHPGDLAVGEPIPVDHQARVRTRSPATVTSAGVSGCGAQAAPSTRAAE